MFLPFVTYGQATPVSKEAQTDTRHKESDRDTEVGFVTKYFTRPVDRAMITS